MDLGGGLLRDIADSPEPWRSLLFIVVITLVLWKSFGEKVTHLPGLLGSAARWFQERKRRAIEEDIAIRRTRVEDLEYQIDQLRADLNALSKSLQSYKAEVEDLNAYSAWVASLHRRYERWVAETGTTLPLPPFMTFDAWREAGKPLTI